MIRVVSVPSGHPYVAATTGPDVEVLPDPSPPGAAPGVWWPPVVFDARWLRDHADRFDLVHVHFGVESFPLDHVAEVVATLRDLGRPLVVTVHDLANPQLDDQTLHLARTGLLVGSAAEVVTLTSSAAEEIASRWGRTATVLPHPSLLPDDAPLPDVVTPPRPVVGVDLKDLRPDVDAVGVLDLLAGLDADVDVRVAMRDSTRDVAVRDAVRERCGGALRLTERGRPDDAELHAWISGLDVAVLPNRHGTHSGWLELCWDLGVEVVAPDTGHYAGQHGPDDGCRTYAAGDRASFAEAVTTAVARATRPGTPERDDVVAARRRRRARERDDVHAALREIYARALAAPRPAPR
ncbi:glycosyltransferase [Solicola sp. PLA-1-18]|uniref:glycosyltransferase n=1 Tax=Solicola sp. PLA-1-18 TaxID=3380532 RepID=UPI003B7902F3